jgi:peroxiredoxin Q/BCP
MAEACSFRDNFQNFRTVNAELFGISPDSEALAKRFAAHHSLPFPLLIDDRNHVRSLYGVRKLLGVFPGRSTFVIGQNRRILHIAGAPLQSSLHVSESLRSLGEHRSA